MNYYSKYGIYLLSTANYSDGVGRSSVQEDFPFELGNQVFYDNVPDVENPVGRHPVTQEPLWVLEYDRYTRTVTQHGVSGTSEGIAAPEGDPITICSLTAEVTNAPIMNSIDADDNHVIYGVWNLIGDPDDLIPALADYYIDSVIPESRWAELEPFMVARGVSQTKIDNWRSSNPNATPNDVKRRFESFVQ